MSFLNLEIKFKIPLPHSRSRQKPPALSLSVLISGKGHLAIETTQTDELGRPSRARGKEGTSRETWEKMDGRTAR